MAQLPLDVLASPSSKGRAASSPASRWLGHLYAQVLVAILLGALIGTLSPRTGEMLEPLGGGFVKLIKMLISPIVFLTICTGIAGMGDPQKLGRVTAKTFAYFVTVSSLALIVGLVAANLLQPGAGMNINPASLHATPAEPPPEGYGAVLVGFLMDIIPSTFLGAFVSDNILQVVLVAGLVGFALGMLGERAQPLVRLFEVASSGLSRLVGLVMRLAPIGAFGAFSFTIGKYGLRPVFSLVGLVGSFYLTAALFVILILGAVARFNGFSVFRLIRYLRSELLLVLGTCSSEATLPSLIEKLERAGCPKPVVGLVVPTGLSFNLDGTNIYMCMAALFIAQATNVHLSIGDQLLLLGVAMICSKGAAGVAGAGFIALAATLAIVPAIPVTGLALILGVDRFMSEGRALINVIGNAVATVVVSRWDGGLDEERLHAALGGPRLRFVLARPVPPPAAAADRAESDGEVAA